MWYHTITLIQYFTISFLMFIVIHIQEKKTIEHVFRNFKTGLSLTYHTKLQIVRSNLLAPISTMKELFGGVQIKLLTFVLTITCFIISSTSNMVDIIHLTEIVFTLLFLDLFKR
jgi:hypothetical protein